MVLGLCLKVLGYKYGGKSGSVFFFWFYSGTVDTGAYQAKTSAPLQTGYPSGARQRLHPIHGRQLEYAN